MTPFQALCVTLRCPSLRAKAVAPFLNSMRAAGFWLSLLAGLVAASTALTFLFVIAPHAAGRAVELWPSPPPPAERVFYAASRSAASSEHWAIAEQTLAISSNLSPERAFSARALLAKSKGFSLMGLSSSERQAILLAIQDWRPKAEARDQAIAKRAVELLERRSASGASAEALLAASALLASAPERLAIESVERATLNARPIDALSVSYWERVFTPDLSPTLAPSSELAAAEWQALSSRSFMVSLKGLLAMAAPLVLAALAGLTVWACRRMAKSPSEALLKAWELQSLQDATGRPTASSTSRRL